MSASIQVKTLKMKYKSTQKFTDSTPVYHIVQTLWATSCLDLWTAKIYVLLLAPLDFYAPSWFFINSPSDSPHITFNFPWLENLHRSSSCAQLHSWRSLNQYFFHSQTSAAAYIFSWSDYHDKIRWCRRWCGHCGRCCSSSTSGARSVSSGTSMVELCDQSCLWSDFLQWSHCFLLVWGL